jgi:predicted nucleotidyltransferase
VAFESNLFQTVSRGDPLGFWADRALDAGRVAHFLGLDRNELARIGGVAATSVRFDSKIPAQLRARLEEIGNTLSLVAEHLQDDGARTSQWLRTRNPLLGEASPLELIRTGGYERLRRHVMDALMQAASAAIDLPVPTASRERASSGVGQPLLALHRDAISQLCVEFGVRRLAAFGSILREDFDQSSSDADFVVDFLPVQYLSPADQYFGFKSALEHLLGRPVDLVELDAMPDSRLKRIIERTQIPVYGQAA